MLCKYHEKIFQNTDQPIAFVLGNYITSLSVIRSLGRKGITVVSIGYGKEQICFYSKYCKGIKSPECISEEGAYIDLLLEIGRLLKHKGVLIACSDIELLAILKNKSKLSKYYHFINSDLPISEILVNKSIFYKMLEKLGIKHPRTFYPKDEDQLLETCKKIDYPCILKPTLSGHFRHEFRTKFVIVNSQKELIKNWKDLKEKNYELLLQEMIPGSAEKMYGLNTYSGRDFKPNGIFMYQRIRECPQIAGNGCALRRANVPELEETVTKLLKNIKYQGIIDAEFKKDERDNSFKLIEVNARPWMQYSFATNHGVDPAYLAYMDAIGKDPEIKNGKFEKNIKWVILPDDLIAAFKEIREKKLTFYQWISSNKGKTLHPFLDWDDPLPLAVLISKSMFNLSFFEMLKIYKK